MLCNLADYNDKWLCTLLNSCIVYRKRVCTICYVCVFGRMGAEVQGWLKGGIQSIQSIQSLPIEAPAILIPTILLSRPPHSRPSLTLLCSPVLFMFFIHLCPPNPSPSRYTLDPHCTPPCQVLAPLLFILSMPFSIFFPI